MAYDYPEPLKKGDYYVAYPDFYLRYVNKEKLFKRYLRAYLSKNETTSIPVGITKDLRLVCRENPMNTVKMVNERRDLNKANKSKSKKGGKKK